MFGIFGNFLKLPQEFKMKFCEFEQGSAAPHEFGLTDHKRITGC